VAPVKAVLEYKTYSRSDAAVPFREFFVEPAKINAAVKATFEQSAGIRHAAGWRVCLLGVVLGLGVPAIAWLEQATMLLLLIATVLVAIAVLYIMHNRRERGY
jgi:hypothetical protein